MHDVPRPNRTFPAYSAVKKWSQHKVCSSARRHSSETSRLDSCPFAVSATHSLANASGGIGVVGSPTRLHFGEIAINPANHVAITKTFYESVESPT